MSYANAVGKALKDSAYDALHWSSFDYLDNRDPNDPTPMATVLRRASGLLVTTNGGIADGQMAEAAPSSGAADVVAIGRPIFAQPDRAYLVRSGVDYPWLDFDPKCSIPDDHISPRRSAFFMARSVLRDIRSGVRAC